jgi:hypothetical protein
LSHPKTSTNTKKIRTKNGGWSGGKGKGDGGGGLKVGGKRPCRPDRTNSGPNLWPTRPYGKLEERDKEQREADEGREGKRRGGGGGG